MKQINDLSLAALSSGLSKALSDELGGNFDVTVQKLERSEGGFGNNKLLLSFVVNDVSHWARYIASKPRYEVPMTSERFKEQAIRTATDTEVTYDVRPLGIEQQQGIAVFLGELVFKLSTKALPISKPLVMVTDDDFQGTDQIGDFIRELGEAGLRVDISQG